MTGYLIVLLICLTWRSETLGNPSWECLSSRLIDRVDQDRSAHAGNIYMPSFAKNKVIQQYLGSHTILVTPTSFAGNTYLL